MLEHPACAVGTTDTTTAVLDESSLQPPACFLVPVSHEVSVEHEARPAWCSLAAGATTLRVVRTVEPSSWKPNGGAGSGGWFRCGACNLPRRAASTDAVERRGRLRPVCGRCAQRLAARCAAAVDAAASRVPADEQEGLALAFAGFPGVAEAAAANPAMPEGALAVLADDTRREVRASVARNVRASRRVLSLLSDDGDAEVAEAARRTLAQLDVPPWDDFEVVPAVVRTGRAGGTPSRAPGLVRVAGALRGLLRRRHHRARVR